MNSLSPTELSLYKIYTNEDDPAAFSSARRLYARAVQLRVRPVSLKIVRDFLRKLKIHQLFTPYSRRKNYERSAMLFPGVNSVWFGDLFLFGKDYPRFNYRFTYIFLLVDGLSRFVMAKPMRTKGGREVAKNLKQMVLERGAFPGKIVTDKGKGSIRVRASSYKFSIE